MTNDMSNEKAIEIIRDCLGFNNIIMPYSGEMVAFGMAIEAIEKQVAKKPIIKLNDYGDNSCYCSSCTTQFLGNISADNIPYSIINFCPKCGQKIDWSDEYDE